MAQLDPGSSPALRRARALSLFGSSSAEWVVADTKLAAAPQEDVHYELFVELVYKD